KSFDAIVAVGIFHHLDLPKAAAECNRLLRNDGFLVVFEPNSLCPLSFIGRKLFKTKIHTPNERPYTYWSFLSEIKKTDSLKLNYVFYLFLDSSFLLYGQNFQVFVF
ncbi:MAG TPA: methyltransferase domain-containing protein, partial [Bacteroidetes bacterium]|nr:methyltransferase domain-containing protein [Bacteroidota bacterium]